MRQDSPLMIDGRRQRADRQCAERAARVLDAAVAIASEQGYGAVSREAIASMTKLSLGTVSNAFGSMDELRREVLRQAVIKKILPIVAAGLALNSDITANASPDLKRRALDTLA